MKRLNVRTFRSTFSKLTEPVEVVHGTNTVGVWYPNIDMAKRYEQLVEALEKRDAK